MKTALITGILGQDGFHLTKLLQSKGYKVFGLLNSKKGVRSDLFLSQFPETKLVEGDLTNFQILLNTVNTIRPQEIYNLGGVSQVTSSFQFPELTGNVNGLGPVRLLEVIRKLGAENDIKFYQASSSEMFGRVNQTPQNELTNFNPTSPYGAAKLYAHNMCNLYREHHGIHVSCGIMYNHEGEHRGENFVTRKITKSVAQISKGNLDKIHLGSIESKRDWGYAGDYVEAMWLMVQQNIPDDFVIATGKAHSVKEFLTFAIKIAGLTGKVEDYIVIDDNFKRQTEVTQLIGDASKAKNTLGWEPKVSFEELVVKMMNHDLSAF